MNFSCTQWTYKKQQQCRNKHQTHRLEVKQRGREKNQGREICSRPSIPAATFRVAWRVSRGMVWRKAGVVCRWLMDSQWTWQRKIELEKDYGVVGPLCRNIIDITSAGDNIKVPRLSVGKTAQAGRLQEAKELTKRAGSTLGGWRGLPRNSKEAEERTQQWAGRRVSICHPVSPRPRRA